MPPSRHIQRDMAVGTWLQLERRRTLALPVLDTVMGIHSHLQHLQCVQEIDHRWRGILCSAFVSDRQRKNVSE